MEQNGHTTHQGQTALTISCPSSQYGEWIRVWAGVAHCTCCGAVVTALIPADIVRAQDEAR